MNASQVMDRCQKEVIQVSTEEDDKKVKYLYDKEIHYYFTKSVLVRQDKKKYWIN